MSSGFTVRCSRIRGQGRPRFGSGRAYEAPADSEWKELIRACWMEQDGTRYGSSPVAIRIDVFRRLPASAPKSAVSEADAHRPDVDNICKSVMDALNGCAYDDDAQVVEVTVKKWRRTRRDDEEMRVSLWEV